MELEDIRIGDIPDYLFDDIVGSVRHHAACFLRPAGTDQPLQQCGSGTFIKYKGQCGILTAAHVINPLRRLDSWCVMLPRGRPLYFERESVEYLCSERPAVESDGPDIGFVRLSPHLAAYVSSIFSFVDLENHRSRLAAVTLPRNHGVWVQVGFPEKLGTATRDESARIVTTGVYCLAAAGGVDSVCERGEFDYYDGKVTYDLRYELPETFKGMSGGGLWQFRLEIRGGRYKIVDRFFSGVVFYETAGDGAVTAIRSHGRKSVYGYAASRLISRDK